MNIKEILEKIKSMKLEELKDIRQKALEEARDICDLAEKEKRDFTTEERRSVKELLDGAKQVKDRINEVKSDQELTDRIAKEFGEDLDLGKDQPQNGKGGGQKLGSRFLSDVRYNTLGEAFVKSQLWNDWLKQIAPGGRIPDKSRGINSPPLEFKRFGLFRKDLITGSDDTSAGAFVESDRTGIYEPLGRYQLNLRDLISVRQTTSDTVEFVRQVTQVTQAEPVPEANVTEYSGATGEVSGKKPEGSTTWERVTEAVKTIAVWLAATKRALSDAAQLRGLIDDELRSDVSEELENQLINGSGVGENFTGLANTAGVLVQAFDENIIRTGRRAITNLLENGKQVPTAWLMHPSDWETIDLLQDNEGRYYWGGPRAMGPPTFWGVPVVQNFFCTQGTAWLGNWRKAVLWDRELANISVTDSHEDFFIRNMVAILAEMRAAFGIIRPSGFVQVDLQGGS